jgi:hypothetical protein
MAEEALRAKAVLDNKKWNDALASMQSKTQVFMRASKVAFKGAVDAGKDLGKQVWDVGKYAAAGAAAAGTAVAAMVKHAIDAGDALAKMSDRTGMAVPFLSKLKYAADQSGTSLEEVEKAIKAAQKKGFDMSESGFLKIAQELSQIQNASEKAARAQEIFGKSGTALLPMLKEGRKGMAGLFGEAEKLSYVWSEGTARAAEALGDSFSRLWTIATGLMDRFGVGLFQSIQSVTDGIKGWYEANKQIIDQKVEAWAAEVSVWIGKAWETVKTFYQDGGFVLWWERAKLAVMGLGVALAGVQSALDYAVAGYYRLLAAKEYWAGSESKSYQYQHKADSYEASAGKRSVGVVKEYEAQAQKVAAAERAMTLNVIVNNNAVGQVTPAQARAIAGAVAKEVKRGRVQTIGEQREAASAAGYSFIGG